MSEEQIAQMLTALAVLLVAVQVLGNAFVRMRQPRVIGEIVAGLLLGPTLLSHLFPEVLAWIFPDSGPVAAVLDAVYQLGLLLLMYCSGAEIRSLFHRGERRTIVGIILGGILVPFLLGLLLISIIDAGTLRGPNASPESFALVFGIAIAITSIPVISRILFDLGVIGTSFSRIVLGAAVAEDVVLYVALAVALGLVEINQSSPFGLPAVLSPDPTSGWNIAYHVAAETAFLGIALLLGPRLLRRTLSGRPNLLGRVDPLALQLAFMFAVSALCVVLGIAAMFGAFVSGIIVGTAKSEAVIRSGESIKRFSFAFFHPVLLRARGVPIGPAARLRRAVLRRVPGLRDRGKGCERLRGGSPCGRASSDSTKSRRRHERSGWPGHRPGIDGLRRGDRQPILLRVARDALDRHLTALGDLARPDRAERTAAQGGTHGRRCGRGSGKDALDVLARAMRTPAFKERWAIERRIHHPLTT